tara:strand:- start:1976 stop:2173 length:198 start_codon:yes stop_codon:yes gene_type:complete
MIVSVGRIAVLHVSPTQPIFNEGIGIGFTMHRVADVCCLLSTVDNLSFTKGRAGNEVGTGDHVFV